MSKKRQRRESFVEKATTYGGRCRAPECNGQTCWHFLKNYISVRCTLPYRVITKCYKYCAALPLSRTLAHGLWPVPGCYLSYNKAASQLLKSWVLKILENVEKEPWLHRSVSHAPEH